MHEVNIQINDVRAGLQARYVLVGYGDPERFNAHSRGRSVRLAGWPPVAGIRTGPVHGGSIDNLRSVGSGEGTTRRGKGR